MFCVNSYIIHQHAYIIWGFQVALLVKNLPANAEYIRGMGLGPGLGRSPGGRHGHPLQYSCLENPWTEETGRLQSIRSQTVGHD